VKQRRSADWLALLTMLKVEAYPAERVVALHRLRPRVSADTRADGDGAVACCGG
jgi:hypothetical protein